MEVLHSLFQTIYEITNKSTKKADDMQRQAIVVIEQVDIQKN